MCLSHRLSIAGIGTTPASTALRLQLLSSLDVVSCEHPSYSYVHAKLFINQSPLIRPRSSVCVSSSNDYKEGRGR